MLLLPRCTWVRPSARVGGGRTGKRPSAPPTDYSLLPLSPPSAEEARAAAPSGPPAPAHLHRVPVPESHVSGHVGRGRECRQFGALDLDPFLHPHCHPNLGDPNAPIPAAGANWASWAYLITSAIPRPLCNPSPLTLPPAPVNFLHCT